MFIQHHSGALLSAALFPLLLAAISLQAQAPVKVPAPAPAYPQQPAAASWKLVWHDEFNGSDGAAPDPAKWTTVTGGGGFGNRELESYTNRPVNVHQEKGNLVITAQRESFTGPDGVARDFTSARLQTKGRFETQYGRIEARIKIPAGQGLWPAFWMMGSNVDAVDWPKCGEIDIMENIGAEPGKVHGTLHGPLYSGGDALTGAYSLPRGKRFADAFHRFSIEWEPDVIRFYVDGVLFETQNSDNIPSFKKWAFNHPFYVLVNLAVGGDWPGGPDVATSFPAPMLVDYIRVYQRAQTPPAKH